MSTTKRLKTDELIKSHVWEKSLNRQDQSTDDFSFALLHLRASQGGLKHYAKHEPEEPEDHSREQLAHGSQGMSCIVSDLVAFHFLRKGYRAHLMKPLVLSQQRTDEIESSRSPWHWPKRFGQNFMRGGAARMWRIGHQNKDIIGLMLSLDGAVGIQECFFCARLLRMFRVIDVSEFSPFPYWFRAFWKPFHWW